MNDLKVIVNQKPAEITFNFDEIKLSLSEQMEAYKAIEVTEEVLTERKKDIATLRKIAKAIDDKRKEVKSSYMLPYEEFEKKAKELIEIINEPINLINTQVKEFEEKKKAEKKQKAYDYYLEKMGGQSEILEFEEVYKDSWLNTNTSFKSIKSDIDTALINRLADLDAITAMQSEVEEKALATYKQTKRLSDAMKIINDYEIQKKAILEAEERRRREEEERRKREEERKARTEQERLAREQRERELAAEKERKAEIERIREEERIKAQESVRNAQEQTVKEEFIPLQSVDEIAFPGTEVEEEELAFPGAEESVSFPSSDSQESEESEINFALVREIQEQDVFKKYLVKATEKQHDLIIQTLNGLGVYWSE